MKSYLIILSCLLCLACANESVKKEKAAGIKSKVQEPFQLKKGYNAQFRLNYPHEEYLEAGVFGAEAYFRDEDDLETAFQLNQSKFPRRKINSFTRRHPPI